MGVWIETCETVQLLEQLRVTPCVGVWIETPHAIISRGLNPSHPAWVCGLKLLNQEKYRKLLGSHPAWVCGLKLQNEPSKVHN